LRSISPEHIEKIISGSHTGVDRTALDVGLELGETLPEDKPL